MSIVVKKYLADLESKLINNKRKNLIELTRSWAKTFPNKAGVYVLFEGNNLVYVGETQSIKERMNDLLDTRHHTVRRKIGLFNFFSTEGFKLANSKIKHPVHIENLVCKWIKSKNKMSYLEVELGRKELEEYLVIKYSPKYNSSGRRGRSVPG